MKPIRFFLIVLIFNVKSSYSEDYVLMAGNHFLDSGNYDLAITEYQRFLYFNPENDLIEEIYYKIGIAFRNQEKWTEAIEAIDKSIISTEYDSIKDDRCISKAVVYLSKGDYSTAEFELLRIANFSDYCVIRKKAYFFLGVCDLYTAKWEEARTAFNNCFQHDPVLQKQVDSLICLSSSLNYKSPTLAKWLSTFLPGAGQIYGGNLKDGLNAILLNSLTSYLLVNSIIENRLDDALIADITLFERYYRGNRYSAEQTAIKFNDQINLSFTENILNHLKNRLASNPD